MTTTRDRLLFITAVVLMLAGFLIRILTDASGTPLLIAGVVVGVLGLVVKSRGGRDR